MPLLCIDALWDRYRCPEGWYCVTVLVLCVIMLMPRLAYACSDFCLLQFGFQLHMSTGKWVVSTMTKPMQGKSCIFPVQTLTMARLSVLPLKMDADMLSVPSSSMLVRACAHALHRSRTTCTAPTTIQEASGSVTHAYAHVWSGRHDGLEKGDMLSLNSIYACRGHWPLHGPQQGAGHYMGQAHRSSRTKPSIQVLCFCCKCPSSRDLKKHVCWLLGQMAVLFVFALHHWRADCPRCVKHACFLLTYVLRLVHAQRKATLHAIQQLHEVQEPITCEEDVRDAGEYAFECQ